MSNWLRKQGQFKKILIHTMNKSFYVVYINYGSTMLTKVDKVADETERERDGGRDRKRSRKKERYVSLCRPFYSQFTILVNKNPTY